MLLWSLFVRHMGHNVVKRQIRVRLAPSLNHLSIGVSRFIQANLKGLRISNNGRKFDLIFSQDPDGSWSRLLQNLIIFRLSVALHVSTHIRYSPYS